MLNGSSDITGILPIANGGTAQATAAAARAATGLNVESATGHGDANIMMAATERYAFVNAAFTAARTWTLPAASTVNPSAPLVIADVAAGVTGTNTLSLAPTGTDKIDGANATVVALNAAKQVILLWSDGISNWKSSGTLPAPGWTSYTPTITAGSGTFTTVSATGRFLTIGKLTFVNIAVTITTNGTAGSWVNASLPNTANVEAILYGREDVVVGKCCRRKLT